MIVKASRGEVRDWGWQEKEQSHIKVIGVIVWKLSSALRGHCPVEITKFRLVHFHVISPNATKYITCWIKRFYRAKQKQ